MKYVRKEFIGLLLIAIIISFSLKSAAQEEDIYSRPVQFERSHNYDVLNYLAEFSFDLEAKQLFGNVEVQLRALKNHFNECLLDAGENMSINSVKDLNGESLEYKHRGDKLTISLSESYNYNDTLSLTISYLSVDPVDDQNIFQDSTDQYPTMIWGPNFPNRVRFWMPCYDFPNDKATHEMIIHAPEGFKAVSNGELFSVKNEKDTGGSVWHWKQDLPHSTYLYVLAVAPYVVFSDSLGDLPVNYWVFPRDSASALPAFSRTPEIISFFNELYNFEYPWAKCDQVMIPPMGGASESTTATLYSNGLIINLDDKGLKDYNFDRIIAHETAHHWWGDLITLRTWSLTWLNESFGTYSDHIWTNRTRGADEGAIDLQAKKDAYMGEAHTKYMRPIVFNRYNMDSPGQNFDRHTYQKGALMLHLLRSILGDDLFFKTISYFLHKNAFQPVDTHDFIKAIKEVTGQNMEWFFDQFFYKPGHPVFELSKSWDENSKVLTMEIRQVQDTIHGVPYAFRLPVSIGIYNPSGKLTRELWLSKRMEKFEFKLDQKPSMVKFDDNNILLKEIRYTQPVHELIFKLGHDDVIGRAEAARLMGTMERSDRITEELINSARDDISWYVRMAALESLENLGYDKISKICRELSEDVDPQVRTTAIRILGNTGEKNLVGFFKRKFQAEDSYRVQAECLRSIGKCGSEKDIPFIQQAGTMTSTRNVIHNSSLAAISTIKKNNN